jgi:hypothetical protein
MIKEETARAQGAKHPSTCEWRQQVNLHFTYDGMLQKSVTWSGDVTGSVSWNYNNDFNKILEVASGATGSAQAVFGYDADQLLTCASPTTCSRPGAESAPAGGVPARSSLSEHSADLSLVVLKCLVRFVEDNYGTAPPVEAAKP